MTGRDRLIIDHLPLVTWCASKYWATPLYEDVRAAGLEALVRSAGRWDPAGGAGFSSYATHRIRGAMIDELRDERRRRGRNRKGTVAFELVSIDAADINDPDIDVIGIDPRDVSLDVADMVISALDTAWALGRLRPSRRAMAAARWLEGASFTELAERHGVTVSAISQKFRAIEADLRRIYGPTVTPSRQGGVA